MERFLVICNHVSKDCDSVPEIAVGKISEKNADEANIKNKIYPVIIKLSDIF